MLANIKAPKNGYAYIYVSNENDESVYFDNLQVAHNRGRIIEEDHYYALGLKIAGISSNKLGNDTYEGYLQNKNLYNDKELIDEADLDWYDYGFRNYDAQIGRFPQLDPLKDDYPELTPFQYASNDPIANIDIDGLEGGSSIGSFLTTANESSKFWLPQAAQLAKTTETVTKVGMSLSSVALRVGLVAANEGLRVGLDGQKSSDIEQRLHVNQVKEINRSWVPQGSNKSVNSITGQIRYSTTASESIDVVGAITFPVPKFGWAFKLLGKGGEVGWKVGEPITNLTAKGSVPVWNTVRQRFWKNEALVNGSTYSEANIIRMRKGFAPQRLNPNTGLMESMELHHHILPQRNGGLFDFMKVWPEEHRAIDPFRK